MATIGSTAYSYFFTSQSQSWFEVAQFESWLGILIRQREGASIYAKGRPLAELLKVYQAAECQDPRDKAFGLLGLAMKCCKTGIRIRYDESVVALYWQILDHEVSHHGLEDTMALLDLSTGIRHVLGINNQQRITSWKPRLQTAHISDFDQPLWYQGEIMHIMPQPIAHLSELDFRSEVCFVVEHYIDHSTDDIEEHNHSDWKENIYEFKD